MRWSRIESMGRAADFADGIAARIADPLWMLGRQWQLGELTGDDATQPAAVRVRVRHAPLVGYQAGDDRPRRLGPEQPLERLVEAGPPPPTGPGAVHDTVRAGERLRRRLDRLGLSQAVAALRTAFPVDPHGQGAVRLGATEQARLDMLIRRGMDGRAVAAATGSTLQQALSELPAAERASAMDVIRTWSKGEDVESSAAWIPERFEHRFSVFAQDRDELIALRAQAHQGGMLDWHSFDVDPDAALSSTPTGSDRGSSTEVTAIAAPVRFAGMPASRWWEFEDGEVNLGDLDAGPADLARLAVAEFATVYNDDWFVVPVRVQRSSLVRVEELTIIDTFGEKHTIRPASLIDSRRDAESSDETRAWRFFELDGDPHHAQKRAPWLLVPPSLASTLHGPQLERVALARDEDANLAWAIERIVEGPLGRPIDRASTWAGNDRAPSSQHRADATWWYELETPPPPWWIPLVPERQDPTTEQVRLRRARMATWDGQDPRDIGPKGTLLEPGGPFFVYEEEVPRSGATVSRSWQWARWQDGSAHLWLQRSKQNGHGERSAGLRWDVLHDSPPGDGS